MGRDRFDVCDSASKERGGGERGLAMQQKLLEAAGLREGSAFLWGKWLGLILVFSCVMKEGEK